MKSWLVYLPILLPLLGAALGLLVRKYHRLQVGLTVVFILAALVCSLGMLYTVATTGQPVVFQLGAWPAPAGITLIGDYLSALMVVMSQIVLAAGILYATGCRDKCVHYPAFYPLFLTLATGLTGALLTGDLFNLFVFAELMVISGAVLTAVSDHRFGVEAAYKYFYISLLASMFLLLGCGALYAAYGTLNMADLGVQIAANPEHPLSGLALVFLLAFFMVKSAVVPFHFWQPDFHTAAPTPVHAVLSSVVVKLGVYGFIRMTTLLFPTRAPEINLLLVVLGCFGVLLGGLGATGTYDAKRMLAYSTLGQIGFILVGIGWGSGGPGSRPGICLQPQLDKVCYADVGRRHRQSGAGEECRFQSCRWRGKMQPLCRCPVFPGWYCPGRLTSHQRLYQQISSLSKRAAGPGLHPPDRYCVCQYHHFYLHHSLVYEDMVGSSSNIEENKTHG